MKKRLLFVLAIVVALLLMAAAPVMACNKHGRHRDQPPSGEQVMVLNAPSPGAALGHYGCEDISWFGTIEIGSKTFGMALYADFDYVGEGVFPSVEYGESWKIFTRQFRVRDGELRRCAPGRVVMAGYDEGVWNVDTGVFQSVGDVEYATRRFKRWDGYKVSQGGTAEPGVSVAGVENAFGFDDGVFNIHRP